MHATYVHVHICFYMISLIFCLFSLSSSITATHSPTNSPGGASLAPPTFTPISTHTPTFTTGDSTSILTKLSPQLSGGSTRSQSLTPVPSEKSQKDEDDEGDRTITEGGSDFEEKGVSDGTILTEEETREEEEEEEEDDGEVSEEISHIEENTDEEEEGDVSETSFRDILPSESHRRRQLRMMRPHGLGSVEPGQLSFVSLVTSTFKLL